MRNIKKSLLHMYLPQSKGREIDDLYKLFRKRALIKSNDAWLENSTNPIQMILNVNLPTSDVQSSVVVGYKSFSIIENSDNEEIGFTAEVRLAFPDTIFTLTVFKSGKAFLEDKKDIEEAIRNKRRT